MPPINALHPHLEPGSIIQIDPKSDTSGYSLHIVSTVLHDGVVAHQRDLFGGGFTSREWKNGSFAVAGKAAWVDPDMK